MPTSAEHVLVDTSAALALVQRENPFHPAAALRLEETNFPESRFLSATDTQDLLRELAVAGLAGGAVYDGLVGAAARKHELPLITCDRRAEPTYRILAVNYELLAPISQTG